MKTLLTATAKLTAMMAILFMMSTNAHAVLNSYYITGPMNLTNAQTGVYQQANLAVYLNPGQTNWIAWSRIDHLASYNGNMTIDGSTAVPNFGIDDSFTLTITGPKGQTSDGYVMDYNNKMGVSTGQQAVIFGNANVAPDVVRFDLGGQPTVFNESGLADSFLKNCGAGWYNLHFDFNNLWNTTAGHNNVYLLVDTFVPEPATLALSALGLAGLAMIRRRRTAPVAA